MNKEQLREKIMEISNSCFPLIDFFNDIGRNKDPRYNKERAYEDIEKIYDVFMHYREKSEILEKENEVLLINKNVAQGIAIKLKEENDKFKQALEILKDKLDIKLEVYRNGGCTLNHKIIYNCIVGFERCLRYLEVEEYKLLKEVLDND